LPDVISGADLIEDDLPTNLDYLDQTARTPGAGEGLRSWQPAGEGLGDCAAEMNGETVKILYDGYLDMEEGYWDKLPVVGNGPVDSWVSIILVGHDFR
jgi:autophagy-related protein 2